MWYFDNKHDILLSTLSLYTACWLHVSVWVYKFDYQGFQFKLQGLLPGFEQHYALLLPVSLSQKLLPTLTLPLQLTLTLQLALSSLEEFKYTHTSKILFTFTAKHYSSKTAKVPYAWLNKTSHHFLFIYNTLHYTKQAICSRSVNWAL